MPTELKTTIDGYAHCPTPRCPGSQQEPVQAVRSETSQTYRERGGDGPGIESSFVHLSFEDPEQITCQHCGRAREVTDQPRKTYAALSGHDPMGLLGADPFNPKKQVEIRQEFQTQGKDPEAESLRKQNEALMERLVALEEKE